MIRIGDRDMPVTIGVNPNTNTIPQVLNTLP